MGERKAINARLMGEDTASEPRYKTRRYMGASDFARAKGISTSTVYRMIERGELQARKILSHWYIPDDAIDEWEGSGPFRDCRE